MKFVTINGEEQVQGHAGKYGRKRFGASGAITKLA
jgi:hypothetical protein